MYIATQGEERFYCSYQQISGLGNTGPLPKTVVDFWRMVWQERCQTIVMLANLVEACAVKCHKYWPETGTMTFGPFNVTITGQQILADYTTREFCIEVVQMSENC